MALYLDYNASSPINETVLIKMIDCYKKFSGNAHSRTHSYGDQARQQIEVNREKIASLLMVSKDEVIFTSGATESNNLVLLGLADEAHKRGKDHIIVSAIEHKAVLEGAFHLGKMGFNIDYLKPHQNGIVTLEDLQDLITEKTFLVSVMHVNNETGCIQPLDEIGSFLKDHEILFHTDATQSAGKLVEELQNAKYDYLSLSAHKMAGPQGIGALIIKKDGLHSPPSPHLLYGGEQEKGIRPGTLPTALIVGFGTAAEIAQRDYKNKNSENAKLKKMVLQTIESSGVNFCINGDLNNSVDNTINISFLGVSSEALLISIREQLAISNGSACTSRNYSNSHVLQAMELDDDIIESAVRISWDSEIKMTEMQDSILKLTSAVKMFQ